MRIGIKVPEWISENSKFKKNLLIELASLIEDIDSVKREKDMEKNLGRIDMLHHFPRDLTSINKYISELAMQINSLKTTNSELKEIVVKPPDSLSISTMFLKAMTEEQLYEMPEDCAEMISNGHQWTTATMNLFIDRLVWAATRSRVLAEPEIIFSHQTQRLVWKNIMEMERNYPRPELLIKEPFEVINSTHGLFPLIVISLRKAYHHSYLFSLISEPFNKGKVFVSHSNDSGMELITIENTGMVPSGEMIAIQEGWLRDLKIFNERLTGLWQVMKKDPYQYSEYNVNTGLWLTEIKFKSL